MYNYMSILSNKKRNRIIYHNFIFYFFKGLIKVYTIELIKYKNDRPQGFLINNVGILISILFSFMVQLLFYDKLSF